MTLVAAQDRDRAEEEDRVAQAWHTARLSRAKRLPSLKMLLQPLQPKTEIDIDQARSDHAAIIAMAEEQMMDN